MLSSNYSGNKMKDLLQAIVYNRKKFSTVRKEEGQGSRKENLYLGYVTEIVSRVFTIVKLKDGTKHGGLKQTSRHEMFTRTEQIFVASHYILAQIIYPTTC